MKEQQPARYHLIDAVRGFAILNMIAYHLVYDIFVVFGIDTAFYLYLPMRIWERFICVTFLIVSGVSLNFSRHPYRRGVIVNLCGFLITAVTVLAVPTQAVWFGVLNLIGCGMMITYAVSGWLKQLRPELGAGISLLLYALLYGVPEGYIGFFGFRLIALPEWLYTNRYFAFLGFPSNDFFSADYFPLIPWVFLFICGWFLWRVVERYQKERWFMPRVPALGWLGRHSLIIYLLHQPALYGICLLMAAAGWLG